MTCCQEPKASQEQLSQKRQEDSNYKTLSGKGTSSNQEQPIIPNFCTAADLNFQQELNWPGGKKTGNSSK